MVEYANKYVYILMQKMCVQAYTIKIKYNSGLRQTESLCSYASRAGFAEHLYPCLFSHVIKHSQLLWKVIANFVIIPDSQYMDAELHIQQSLTILTASFPKLIAAYSVMLNSCHSF